MATMVTEVYDALIDAGASEAKARDAATVLANYDSQFSAIRSDIADLRGTMKAEFADVQGTTKAEFGDVRGTMKAEFADVRSDIKLLKWMNGVTWAMSVAILLRLFIHA